MIDQYKKHVIDTFDINIFNKLLIRLENNIYGFSNSNSDIIKLYLKKEYFKEFIDDLFLKIYTCYQNNTINQFYTNQLLNEIIAILEKEIKKCNGNQINDSIDKEYCIEKAKEYINNINQINQFKTL